MRSAVFPAAMEAIRISVLPGGKEGATAARICKACQGPAVSVGFPAQSVLPGAQIPASGLENY